MLSLLDDLVQIPMHSMCDEINCVTLNRTECIEPFSEVLLTVRTPLHVNNQSVLLEELQQIKWYPIAVANALKMVRNSKTVCRILNLNPYVVTLKKGLKIAKILNLDTIAAVQKYNEVETVGSKLDKKNTTSRTELDNFLHEYGFQISPSLNEDQRYEVLDLLYKYKSVFARDVTDIKACKGPPIKLDVHTNRKMIQRQYRLSDTDKT